MIEKLNELSQRAEPPTNKEYIDIITQRYPAHNSIIKKVFRYNRLTKIQQLSAPKLICSESNALINSPTGSGKTFLFELSLLNSLLNSKQACKYVYIAPTKSLCHEIFIKWTSLFGNSLKSLELNSDFVFSFEEEQNEIEHADILITTPEKFDIIIKRWKQYDQLIKQLKLVMVDELHLLDDDTRGPCIESSLTRFMFLQRYHQSSEVSARIVCASASFSNISEVASWLNVPTSNLLVFGKEFRPVIIEEIVKGFRPAKNPYIFDISLNKYIAELVIDYSDEKPTLVFCPTQKSTQLAAECLITETEARLFVNDEKHLQELTRASTRVDNNALKSCLLNGVGFHNAGLSQESRSIVEDLFRNGNLKVLFTTSTLAQGVNLPAFLVIIKGTNCYRGSAQGYTEYKPHEVLQMIGRAGRPDFETSARSIIMTENSRIHFYENIGSKEFVIRSHYLNSFIDDLNNEVSINTIEGVDSAIQFIQSTFYYARLNNENKARLSADIFKIVKDSFSRLVELGLLEENEQGVFYSNFVSRELARQCIGIESLADTLLAKPKDLYLERKDILDLACKNSIFERISSKMKDRKDINELSKDIEFPLKKSATSGSLKVFVLVQAHAERIDIRSWDLKTEAKECSYTVARILRCLSAIMNKKGRYYECLHCLNWSTSITRQASIKHPETIFTQIYKINKKMAKDIVDQKIFSISELQSKDLSFFVNIKGKGAGDYFGKRIIDSMKCVPRWTLEYSTEKLGENKIDIVIRAKLNQECCDHFYHQRAVFIAKISCSGALFTRHLSSSDSFDFSVSRESLPFKASLTSTYYYGLEQKLEIEIKGGAIISNLSGQGVHERGPLLQIFDKQKRKSELQEKSIKKKKARITGIDSQTLRDLEEIVKEQVATSGKKIQYTELQTKYNSERKLGFLKYVPRKKYLDVKETITERKKETGSSEPIEQTTTTIRKLGLNSKVRGFLKMLIE